jgi:hypothetical protein
MRKPSKPKTRGRQGRQCEPPWRSNTSDAESKRIQKPHLLADARFVHREKHAVAVTLPHETSTKQVWRACAARRETGARSLASAHGSAFRCAQPFRAPAHARHGTYLNQFRSTSVKVAERAPIERCMRAKPRRAARATQMNQGETHNRRPKPSAAGSLVRTELKQIRGLSRSPRAAGCRASRHCSFPGRLARSSLTATQYQRVTGQDRQRPARRGVYGADTTNS